MSDNDTPRTDAESSVGFSGDAMCVTEDFARTLERELAAARAELEGVKACWLRETALLCDTSNSLESERDQARAELAEARECLRECIKRELVWWANCDCELTDMGIGKYAAMVARWRKAAGVDSATPTQSGNS